MSIDDGKIGSGVGADYIALCRKRAETAAKGQKESAVPRPKLYGKSSVKTDLLAGFTLYVPAVRLPMVGLQKWGMLTLPPAIAHLLGTHVQVLWSADRKALALRSCTEISEGALVIEEPIANKPARLNLASIFKRFGVHIVASSRYGAAVTDGVLILALTDVEIGDKQT